MTPEEVVLVRPLLVPSVLAANPPSWEVARVMCRVAWKYLLWAHRVGYPSELEVLWQPRLVAQHVEGYLVKELGLPGKHWATNRSYLERMGRAVVPDRWPSQPQAADHKHLRDPYLWDEVLEFQRLAAAMPTPLLRQQLRGLVAGAAGAGLGVGDFRYLRGSDIRQSSSGGITVTVAGDRQRKVVAFDEFTKDLLYAARRAGSQLVLSGEQDQRKHLTGKVTERVRKVTGIRIQASRLRSAWLTRQLSRGTPMQLLAPAAGIKSLRMLEELLPFAEAPSGDHQVWFR